MGSGLRRPPLSLLLGAAMLLLFIGTGLVSLVWTPYDSEAIDVANRLAPPGTEGYLLGTDGLGRDVLTQVMAGA